jgi:hypothetical protein
LAIVLDPFGHRWMASTLGEEVIVIPGREQSERARNP